MQTSVMEHNQGVVEFLRPQCKMGIPLLQNLGCKELYKARLTQLTEGIPLKHKTIQNQHVRVKACIINRGHSTC